MKVAVAGASGFIGRSLCDALAGRCEVVRLSRRAGPGVAKTDLFSLMSVEEALEGADVAVYLVHSMMPPSRLTQGRFEDLDVILADNFARAARFCGVKRIVYLGGLIPEGPLSPHLASRLEVERVLAARDTPVTTLRAGLVVGAGGSSFVIMEKLVQRLAVMLCPRWTSRRCQPIAVDDVVRLLAAVILDEAAPAGAFDVAGPDVVSYREMMRRTAAALGKRRVFLPIGVFSPRLSRLWVSVVTGSPRALVYPLIESLRHDMVAKERSLQARYGVPGRTFDEALRTALAAERRPSALPAKRRALKEASTVTSVQRLCLPRPREIADVAREYTRWLPHTLRPFLHVKTVGDDVTITLRPLGPRGPSVELLVLTFSLTRSGPTRQLFYITGGRLLRRRAGAARGRLEFRSLPGSTDVLAAVLDFRPRLPWWLYNASQAVAHLLVMRLFARHLTRQGGGS